MYKCLVTTDFFDSLIENLWYQWYREYCILNYFKKYNIPSKKKKKVLSLSIKDPTVSIYDVCFFSKEKRFRIVSNFTRKVFGILCKYYIYNVSWSLLKPFKRWRFKYKRHLKGHKVPIHFLRIKLPFVDSEWYLIHFG